MTGKNLTELARKKKKRTERSQLRTLVTSAIAGTTVALADASVDTVVDLPAGRNEGLAIAESVLHRPASSPSQWLYTRQLAEPWW